MGDNTARTDPAEQTDHRLPERVRPSGYRLRLQVDPDAPGFSGSVAISLELSEPTAEIVLHALDLDIERAVVAQSGREQPLSAEPDPDRQWVTLRSHDPLDAGPADLSIEYSGDYCTNLVGLYISELELELEGETQRLAVTQCESTHARRILPCFDEPAFKATFEVTLEVPTGSVAISNGAESDRHVIEGTGNDIVRFAPTMPMSSYLFAIVVGPLETTEAPPVPGRDAEIPLRIVHPPGRSHLCGFAVEVATAALTFFEEYYDLSYPGDKVDLVAIPDFAFGAMENLGCVTFREVLLLVDPETAAPLELQRVADVINHELAHMWFGDLVTMRWWNGIWLNEAFATFMEISASDAFRPEWDVWTTFGLARAAAFDTDALSSTRPVEYEVITAADSEAMFDILTYEKGASILRMLEQYLGAEAFREGVRTYLRRHAYANTETSDLWTALEDATGEPVRDIAESWIFRGGHPLVSVERTDPGHDLRLIQRRARYRRLASAEKAPDPFPVPMGVLTRADGGEERIHRLILTDEAVIELGEPASLVRTNPSGNGFFRSLLPRHERAAVLAAVDSPLERFVVLDDTWFAVMAAHVDPAEILATIGDLAALGEADPSVWKRAASILAELDRLVSKLQRRELAEWTRDTLGNLLETHPPITSTDRRAEVAATLLGVLGVTGADPVARATATAVFDGEHPGVHSSVSAAALEVVAHDPDDGRFAEIRRRWREAPTPQDEQRHLSALVATINPAQFGSALEECLDGVRAQDAPYVLRRALANRERGTEAWDFVVHNFATICDLLPSGSIPRMFEGIRSFTDEWTALAIERFLGDHPLPTGERQVTQHIERMQASVAAATRIRGYPARFWEVDRTPTASP